MRDEGQFLILSKDKNEGNSKKYPKSFSFRKFFISLPTKGGLKMAGTSPLPPYQKTLREIRNIIRYSLVTSGIVPCYLIMPRAGNDIENPRNTLKFRKK